MRIEILIQKSISSQFTSDMSVGGGRLQASRRVVGIKIGDEPFGGVIATERGGDGRRVADVAPMKAAFG